MLVETDDLVSSSDIADILGVVPSAITNWRKRHKDFPEPVITIARGHTPLWRKQDITDWFRQRVIQKDMTVVSPAMIDLIKGMIERGEV